MNLEKTIQNLEKNNMRVLTACDRAEALRLVREMLPAGAVVTHGGSVTLQECGVTDLLKNGDYQYLDRSVNPEEIYRKTAWADYYITGSNAVTENGELYNVDGNSNRISAIAFGPKHVIVLAGQNKIVPTLKDAVLRVKTVAAPLNAKRLSRCTYCARTGRCVSLNNEHPEMTDGCDSPERICRTYLVSGKQKDNGRITVILIAENLGY